MRTVPFELGELKYLILTFLELTLTMKKAVQSRLQKAEYEELMGLENVI